MQTYELKQSPEQWNYPNLHALLCPVCGYNYNRLDSPHVVIGDPWAGNGDLIVIPGKCESGHEFEVCFGFHKGETVVFCRGRERA